MGALILLLAKRTIAALGTALVVRNRRKRELWKFAIPDPLWTTWLGSLAIGLLAIVAAGM